MFVPSHLAAHIFEAFLPSFPYLLGKQVQQFSRIQPTTQLLPITPKNSYRISTHLNNPKICHGNNTLWWCV
jgi:hypothetical protein